MNKSCSKYFANDTTNFSTVLMNTHVVDSSSIIKIEHNINNFKGDYFSAYQKELESLNITESSMNESKRNDSFMVQMDGENLNNLHALNSINYLKQDNNLFTTACDNSTHQLFNSHRYDNFFEKSDAADLDGFDLDYSANYNHQMGLFSYSSCCSFDLPPKPGSQFYPKNSDLDASSSLVQNLF